MDKLLTKEQIIEQSSSHYSPISNAMDLWAKQESVAFSEFSRDYEWSGKWGCWIPKGVAFIAEDERYTTEQLYELYLQQSK